MRLLIGVLLLVWPCAGFAQVVRGRVLEATSEQPVRAATLELLDDRQKVLVRASADSLGEFRLRGWLAAKYQVRVTALGYRTVTSELLELATGDEFQLDVRLVAEAIDLRPITVTARSRSPLSEIALRGYYDRRDSGRRIGMGRFYDRGEIIKLGTRLSDVLTRVPGLRILDMGSCKIIAVSGNLTGTNRLSGRRDGTGECLHPQICAASVYLDGLLLKSDRGVSFDQMVPLDWIEAIEVYRRAAEMPAEFLGSGACGVVAVWTRHG